MSRNIKYAKIDELGLQVPISWNGNRWIIVSDNIPNAPVNGVYRAGNRDYFLVLDPDERGRLNGDPNQLVSTLWRLDHQSGQLIAARDFSGEGVTGLVQKVSRHLPAKPKNITQLLSDPPQVGGSPRLPKNLDLQISHDNFVRGLEDISELGGWTYIDLESPDGSITLQLNVVRNANGDLSLGKTARFEMEGDSIDAEVAPLPARDGGYQITAQGRTFYFYGGRDANRYWVNQGYLRLLGPNPHSGEELRIAQAITHTRGDASPIRQLLQVEINKRPLPSSLHMEGEIPKHKMPQGDSSYYFNVSGNGYSTAIRAYADETLILAPQGSVGETDFRIRGPYGFDRVFSTVSRDGEMAIDTGTGLLKITTIQTADGVRVYISSRSGLPGNSTTNTDLIPVGRQVILNARGISSLLTNESGSTHLDYDAYLARARAQGFEPHSAKAFCTFANLGLATLTGMGVDYFFNHEEENREHQNQIIVGAWRHIATALTTSFATSRFFSSGRISMTQALESYAKGMLTGLPIDFGFNTTGFGSSPFGFAASYLANHFGDNVVDALIARNPLASKLAATAGLALFLGSTAYSYYNETRQNKPNPLA